MDFNFSKPSHWFSLLMVSVSVLLLIGLPVLSFIGVFGATDASQISELSGMLKLFFEIFLLTMQMALVVVFMVITPVLWYLFVNRFTAKEIKSRLKLKFKEFDKMVLWGILTVFLMFASSFILSILLVSLGLSDDETSNIQDIANLFSPITMFILIVTQPIGEEIFFRGFLLDKIDSIIGKKATSDENGFNNQDYKVGAVLITSVLFGIAHLSYGKPYPAIVITVLGIILGFVVVKTKNLYPAIIAHILFNAISFAIFLLFEDLVGF